LSGEGPVYTLPISGFTASGFLNVNMATKRGFEFTGGGGVQVHHITPVTFTSAVANGTAGTTTTTQLTLTFSAPIPGLAAADITLTGMEGLEKGTLTGTGPQYTLPISGITAAGTVTVTVARAGFHITGTPTATIHLGPPAVPANVRVERTQAGVVVSWDPVPTATSYIVQRATSNTETSFTQAGTTSDTTFTVTAGENDSGFIRVRAVNSTGEGTASAGIRFESWAFMVNLQRLAGTWRNNIDTMTFNVIATGREIVISGTSLRVRDPAISTSFHDATITTVTGDRIYFRLDPGTQTGRFNYEISGGILFIWDWNWPVRFDDWRMNDRFTTAANGNPNNTIDAAIWTRLAGNWVGPTGAPAGQQGTINFWEEGGNRGIRSTPRWSTNWISWWIKHLDSKFITFGNQVIQYEILPNGSLVITNSLPNSFLDNNTYTRP